MNDPRGIKEIGQIVYRSYTPRDVWGQLEQKIRQTRPEGGTPMPGVFR